MGNKKIYLGIDTSNYTTSVALCDDSGRIIANIKKLLDVKEGERGLRQSDAVFSHVKNFPLLAEQIRNELFDGEIAAIGVSVRPRDVEGSYMPCFLAGKAVAEMIAATHKSKVSYFSHQAGHIMASLYSSGATDELCNAHFVAFHVSGGTTEVLYVKPNESSFDVEILADTADISAGQAIDRAGVMMGLKFPCGKEMESLAMTYEGKLPKAKISVKNGKCNLSGLENMAQKLYFETEDKALVAAFVLDFVSQTLVALTKQVREKHPEIPIIYAGGVMSNKMLKEKLSAFDKTYFAEPAFSADNAAGIALLAKKNY
jgi:N6-L-threonylcarbamoyladenine synthase